MLTSLKGIVMFQTYGTLFAWVGIAGMIATGTVYLLLVIHERRQRREAAGAQPFPGDDGDSEAETFIAEITSPGDDYDWGPPTLSLALAPPPAASGNGNGNGHSGPAWGSVQDIKDWGERQRAEIRAWGQERPVLRMSLHQAGEEHHDGAPGTALLPHAGLSADLR